jgi:hypothetical protein
VNELNVREIETVRTLTTLHCSQHRQNLPPNTALYRDWAETHAWGWQENIIGFGVSRKRTAGHRVKGQISVTVFVKRKAARAHMLAKEVIPERLTLASVGAEVVTDIVQLRARPVAQAAGQIRPLRPGADIGHRHGLRGTVGLIVRRVGQPEVKLALSCSHVLARSGYDVQINDEVDQPLAPANQVGTLDSFSTIFPKNTKNTEDFALAALTVAATPALLGSGTVIQSASQLTAAQFKPGWKTQRSSLVGSGLNRAGTIRAFQSTWTVDHMPFVGSSIFADVVAYDTPNAEGDSGAAVLNAAGTEVWGIHFAGSPSDKLGLFLPIGPILQKHHLELVTEANP